MNKKGQVAIYKTPNWFLVIITIAVIFALIIEVGFFGIFFYSCYVKNQCMIPFFFGFGRFMVFPIIWGGYSQQTFTDSYQECYANGIKINCSELTGNEIVKHKGVAL